MKLEPLSQGDMTLLSRLMDEEERAWLSELDWDYSPIHRILASFLEQRLLPGFMLSDRLRACAYTYFLTYRHKGVIGTLYAAPPAAQQAADQILSRAIQSLQEMRSITRIEAQLIPLHGLDPGMTFSRHGFCCFLRHYMELDLEVCEWPEPKHAMELTGWETANLAPAAGVAFRSYRNQIDARISEDYTSEANCESYLNSLVNNPGCGIFLPDSSFLAMDRHGVPCGFILTSRISAHAAMIPQISIHPAHQGRGLGTILMRVALKRLRSAGFRSARLTVTHENRRAYEWYQRLGFRVRRDFGAYLWQAPSREVA